MIRRPRSMLEFGRKLAVVALLVSFMSLMQPLTAAAEESPAAPSIYRYIQLHVDESTGRLDPDAMTLPDEPATRRFSRLRWVPGALEGLGTRHVQWDDASEKAARVILLLEDFVSGSTEAEAALYDLLRADDVVIFYTQALDYAATRIPDGTRLHDLALRLATESRDRGPVKFGIAMLGSMGDERDLDVVRTLALHDEFGLYAAEAIAELAPERQDALYRMAQQVSGWGRIEAVTLMTATPDAKLRKWLLTEGFRNDVSAQYLATHCATIADLEGALSGELAVDAELLGGVAELLQSLTKPAPARDAQSYVSTPQAAVTFLRHVQERKDSLGYLLAAKMLNDYAPNAPWDAADKQAVTALAAPIANDKSWRRRVKATISDDRADLPQAETAANSLGMETFDLHLRRLARNGAVAERWRLAFTAADPRQIEALLDMAERTFSKRFAASTADRGSTSDAALEAVLESLAKLPGTGIVIIDASLLDLSPRVRRAAVDTLVRWGGRYLREDSVRAALTTAVREETDEALKARMVALLNVGALP